MPVLFNIIPAFISFVFSLALIPCGDIILACATVISFAQIVDPIFTVMLISDYKEALVSFKNKVRDWAVFKSNFIFGVSKVWN